MYIYCGYICIFMSNMKFLSLTLWLGGLCTDANDASDANANDTNDTDNYARWKNHDHIGSFGRIPNEPKNEMSFLTCHYVTYIHPCGRESFCFSFWTI